MAQTDPSSMHSMRITSGEWFCRATSFSFSFFAVLSSMLFSIEIRARHAISLMTFSLLVSKSEKVSRGFSSVNENKKKEREGDAVKDGERNWTKERREKDGEREKENLFFSPQHLGTARFLKSGLLSRVTRLSSPRGKTVRVEGHTIGGGFCKKRGKFCRKLKGPHWNRGGNRPKGGTWNFLLCRQM